MNPDYLNAKSDYIKAVKDLAETLESILEDVEPSGAPDAFEWNHDEYLERHQILVEKADQFGVWLEAQDQSDADDE
jgi:hypothetical protein